MKLTTLIIPNILRMLTLSLMILLVACGSNSDDDDDTSIVINQPAQEREEGPASSGGTVIINNNFNPIIKIKNKNVVVDNDEDELQISCDVDDADPVVHQHFVYVANSCNVIINNDLNGDNIIDREEVEQAVGVAALSLSESEGRSYQYSQSVPLNRLPPENENFIFVVYGAEDNQNAPIACFPFVVNIVENDTTSEEAPPAETAECLTGPQQQNIRNLFSRVSDWNSFDGTLVESPAGFEGLGPATFTQTGTDSWSLIGLFKEDPLGSNEVNYSWRGEIKDGCFYSRGVKSELISDSQNGLTFKTETSDSTEIQKSFSISGQNKLDVEETQSLNGESVKETELELVRF